VSCPSCNTTNSPKELKGLALTLIPGKHPQIAEGGTHLPVQVFFCQCGRLELFLENSRAVVEGEPIGSNFGQH
jgi:hypothetical protein